MRQKTKILIFFLSLVTISCGFWQNFTTYFNTYYNANRLITESENEFEYQDEKFINSYGPRTFAPDYQIIKKRSFSDDIPSFMNEFVINKTKLQPVRVKLDSVIIKGSKILANKRESNYIEGTLYLMAQAYFYKSEWLPCQVKCGELIDVYPDGKKSPDAHLLFSKALLIQKKFDYGKKMLSRTVDIAWQLKRYDILSEAFRLQADLALHEDDTEGALRPYRQAIAQSRDSRLRAKWQLELAAILYKLRQYERAEVAFYEVYDKFNPDYVQLFEAKLYQAISLAKVGKFDESDEILTYLEDDGKFDEYIGFTNVGRLYLLRAKLNIDTTRKDIYLAEIDSAERHVDTFKIGNKLNMVYHFERGIDKFFSCNYTEAKVEFDKSKQARTDIFYQSGILSGKLGTILKSRSSLRPYQGKIKPRNIDNKQMAFAAKSAFEAGRAFEEINLIDSVVTYYEKALFFAPPNDRNRPRYIYAVSKEIREKDPIKADSLLQAIVDEHPNTVYSVEAMKLLGFTDAYLIDTAKEWYSSGNNLRTQNNYDFALTKYYDVFKGFPKSKYAPKSLYTMGWVYEKEIKNLDSAMKYYRLLLDNYPNTVFSNDIKISLAYLENERLGKEIPDSLNVAKQKSDLKRVLNDMEINLNLPEVDSPDQTAKEKNFLKRMKNRLMDSFNSKRDSLTQNVKNRFNKIQDFKPDSSKILNPSSLIDKMIKLKKSTSDSTKTQDSKSSSNNKSKIQK